MATSDNSSLSINHYDVALLPGMQLTFHYANRLGPQSSVPSPIPAQIASNAGPWGISAYEWTIPNRTFSRADYFVLAYLLEAGYLLPPSVASTPYPDQENIGTAAAPRNVVDLMREYAWEATSLGLSDELTDNLGNKVFSPETRCLQLEFSYRATPHDMLPPPPMVEQLQQMVDRGNLGDFCDSENLLDVPDPQDIAHSIQIRGCSSKPPALTLHRAALSATFRLPTTAPPRQLPSLFDRTVIVSDWSNFFFTDWQALRHAKYAGNPAFGPGDQMEARGFVTAAIPVYLHGQQLPVYVPFDWSVRHFEHAYGLRVLGIRRVCEFFVNSGGDDCYTHHYATDPGTPPPNNSGDDPAAVSVISRADRRVTMWFSTLRARDAIRLAPGHPDDYIRIDGANSKCSMLLAAYDFVYTDDDKFANRPPFDKPLPEEECSL